MRDLTGWEDHHHSAIRKPAPGLPEDGHIAARGILTAEDVDQEEEISHFGYAAEHGVCKHLDVGSQRAQDKGRRHAVDTPEWVVGHHNRRSLPRHAREIALAHLNAHVEAIEDLLEKPGGVVQVRKLEVLAAHVLETEETFHGPGDERR